LLFYPICKLLLYLVSFRFVSFVSFCFLFSSFCQFRLYCCIYFNHI
jgi:hypothetical protein